MIKLFSLLIFSLLAHAFLPGCKTPKAATKQETPQQQVTEQPPVEIKTPEAEQPVTPAETLNAADVLPGTWGVGEITMGDFVQNEMASGTFSFKPGNIMVTSDPTTGTELSATYTIAGDTLIWNSEHGQQHYRIIHLTRDKVRMMIMNNGIPAYFTLIRLNVD